MVKNGKMTIDKLGQMVSNRFDEIEEKMTTKGDLEGLERRLSNKIESIGQDVGALEETDIRNLHHRVFNLEKDVKILKRKHV